MERCQNIFVTRENRWIWRIAWAATIAVLFVLNSNLTQAARGADLPQSSPELRIEGGISIFSTQGMIAEVKDGAIVRLVNRLTGTEYITDRHAEHRSDVATGLVYAERTVTIAENRPNVIGPTLTKKGEVVSAPKLHPIEELQKVSFARTGTLSVHYLFRSSHSDFNFAIDYALDPKTGDLMVTEKVDGQRTGLVGVRWGLGPITIRGNLLLPAFNGIKAVRPEIQYKFEGSTWAWPMGWQIPLVEFEDPAGGVWVHAEDCADRFKEVNYEEVGSGEWKVAFSTVNQAPFEKLHSMQGLTWRVNTFAGDWRVPVDLYRRWAYSHFDIPAKEKLQPQWVRDIKVVIKHADYMHDNEVVPFLDLLQRYVNPSQTLLFLTFWKDDEQKQPLPYWLPNHHGILFAREARRRGFKVMYFANYIGIMPNHSRFGEFKDHIVRDPYSGKMQGWNLEGEWAGWNLRGDRSPRSNVRLYYVDPAYKPWRDYQIQQFKELFAQSPADGLFLDQAFLIFNDGNGPVGGRNMVQANLDFHREIERALPGIALGGESVNEITMQYESFCELHFLSLDLEDGKKGEPIGWRLDPAAFDRMVPLTTRYISPHTRPIGYVGFPETQSPYYEGWRDALRLYGGIPTLTRPTFAELQDKNSEVRRVLGQAFPDR